MLPRVPDFVAAELHLRLGDAATDAIDRVRASLSVFRVVGLVHDDDAAQQGIVTVTVAAVPGRGMLVDTADGVAPTPVQPIVDAMSARLTADVLFAGADEFAASAATPRPDDDNADDHHAEATAEERATAEDPAAAQGTVYIVGGDVALAPDRRGELASQLESDLTVAPLGDRVVIATRNAPEFVYWSRAQRPVVGLRASEHEFSLAIFPRRNEKRASLQQRALLMTTPGWMASWHRPPIALIDDPTRESATEVQAVLAREREAAAVGDSFDDADTLAALGIDGARLTAALGRPLDRELVAEVVAALQLPPEIADAAWSSGSDESGASVASIDALPGSMRIENRGLRGAVSDAMFAEPEGDSVWARWRRLPHRHPGRAAALIVGELVVAITLGVVAVMAEPPAPWGVVLWIAAALLAVDAVGDAVILQRIRSHRRRQA